MIRKQKIQQLLDIPEVQSWRAIMNAYTQIYRFLETELLKEKCTIPRFQIFFYLYFEGPQSSIELAEKLNVTRGNISTFIRRLNEDSLILIHDATGRGGRQLIELSKNGQKQFEEIFPEHIKRVTKAMPKLSKATINQLKSIQIEKDK